MTAPTPAGEFFPRLYAELKRLASSRLASEPTGHTLNATALVHETYLRLGGAAFADRSIFFRAAAVAMQRILVDHARAKRAAKRGGGQTILLDVDDEMPIILATEPDLLLDVGAAIDRLAAEDPGAADVARLRLFAGMAVEDAATALGISRATAFREWAYARSWLAEAITDD